jgi:hypothetical protein
MRNGSGKVAAGTPVPTKGRGATGPVILIQLSVLGLSQITAAWRTAAPGNVACLNGMVAVLRMASVVFRALGCCLLALERPAGALRSQACAWASGMACLYLFSLWRFGRFVALW